MQSYFSNIEPRLKRYLIRRSSLFALPGFFLLLYMGIFLSTSALQSWGLWGFAAGFSLISMGMIPYRRVIGLETKPHHLAITDKELRFTHARKGEVVFPFKNMTKMDFIQRRGFYGIRLHLNDGSHFLLPYFSQKTFSLINDYLSKNQ